MRAGLASGVLADPGEREALASVSKPTHCGEIEGGKGAATIVGDTEQGPMGVDAQVAGGLSPAQLLFCRLVRLKKTPLCTIERESGHHPFSIITISHGIDDREGGMGDDEGRPVEDSEGALEHQSTGFTVNCEALEAFMLRTKARGDVQQHASTDPDDR